ncbi:ATP-grasp domain-containing protein [Candidatus Uhrbacteria bacterium]|nr:ATP-grasp domain-containing protein [Candidatus Uhrbacteria bacterium]
MCCIQRYTNADFMLPNSNMPETTTTDFHLDPDIYTNETNYFFSLLGPRFDVANQSMTRSLEKKFGGVWKPIFIYSAHPGPSFMKDNFIVLNGRAKKIETALKEQIIYLQEYEDLNREFLASDLVQEIIQGLLRKQERAYIYPFTTAFLETNDPRIFILGPDSKVAKRFDDKIAQYLLFQELDLPRNRAQVFATRDELLAQTDTILPCYISASYSSGGNESGLIYSKEMLESFLGRLRDVNTAGPFLVAHIFEKMVLAPNVSAFVSDIDKTNILTISDQILRGNRYLGNVYPSIASEKHRAVIRDVTEKIGSHLSRQGFRGLFGCDFLINQSGDIVTVDLNPRRQGGYACNLLALQTRDVQLTDYELECALNKKVHIDWKEEDIQYQGCWAHSKIKPHEAGQRITQDFQIGDLPNTFQHAPSRYEAIFYAPRSILIDGYVGYVVATDVERERVLEQVNKRVSELIAANLL